MIETGKLIPDADKRLNRDGIPEHEFNEILEMPGVWFPPTPVGGAAERQRELLQREIGSAMLLLGSMAALINRRPLADATFNALDAELLAVLFRAGDRMRAFRNSRGCEGEA